MLFTFSIIWGLLRGILASSDDYVAAVVEHSPILAPILPVNVSTAQSLMMKNLASYEKHAINAKQSGAQIVVFPEDGIYGVTLGPFTNLPYMENIPSSTAISTENINPCLSEVQFEDRPVLRRLSCLARDLSIAIVANMGDVQPCQPLTDKGCRTTTKLAKYNTDVAFDTDGRLLAKYHKKHLFFEYEYTEPESASLAVFTTSFGVKFGLFTCFDMLFQKPAQELVRRLGIKNIAFPTAWINSFPYLASVAVQQAWSRAMGVNVLAANLHIPTYNFTGSGIYSSGKVISEFMSSVPGESELLMGKVNANPLGNPPKIGGDDHYVNKSYKPDPEKHPQFVYKALVGNEGAVDACHGNFCCHAKFSRQELDGELYALGAFSGMDEHEPEEYKIQVCTLRKCATTLSQCSQQTNASQTMFSFLSINGSFSESTFIYPVFMLGNRQLLQPEFVHVGNGSMTYNDQSVAVLTATLYGRIFTETVRE
ncbi:pantetheinase-like [Oscarella lobularis]|uniref:pantetheinase-like n=1 Tax=Oscarella lobularis TaxID=121494 RepID=UPI0033137DE9